MNEVNKRRKAAKSFLFVVGAWGFRGCSIWRQCRAKASRRV